VLSDDRLMAVFTEYVAWQNYASTNLAEAEVIERRAEARLENFKQQGTVLNWDAEPSDKRVTVAKAKALTSPEYEKLQQAYLIAYANRKMTESVYENCERSAALVSRELTRRIGREPMERRLHRWAP
jgi:hypothetical protein